MFYVCENQSLKMQWEETDEKSDHNNNWKKKRSLGLNHEFKIVYTKERKITQSQNLLTRKMNLTKPIWENFDVWKLMMINLQN